MINTEKADKLEKEANEIIPLLQDVVRGRQVVVVLPALAYIYARSLSVLGPLSREVMRRRTDELVTTMLNTIIKDGTANKGG